MSTVTVSNGQTSTGLTVVSGETLIVNSGGKIVSTLVNSGGIVTISSGGIDSGSIISSGGTETVLSGGSASGDQIYGVLNVISTGPTAISNETVDSGGLLTISKSATVSNTTLSGGGTVSLLTQAATLGGTLTFAGGGNTLIVGALTTTVGATGDLAAISGFGAGDKIDITALASAGASLSVTTSGGNTIANVVSGGVTVEAFIFSGTTTYNSADLSLIADAGGKAEIVFTSAAVSSGVTTSVTSVTASGAFTETSGNTLLVLSGGSVSAASIASGGALVVNGGADSASVISAGGVETVSAGSASGDKIYGAATIIGGAVASEIVQSGGLLTVNASATVSGDTILAGGSATILGTASGDQISGVEWVSGATAVDNNAVVFSGGALDLEKAGAVASGALIKAGGALNINGAITASNTTVSGGGVVDLQSAKATLSGSLVFQGGNNTLEIAALASTSAGAYGDQAVISGFSTTDKIDIAVMGPGATLTFTSNGDGAGDELVTVNGTSGGVAVTESFLFAGSAYNNFTLGTLADGAGGVEVVYNPNATTLIVSAGVSAGLSVTSGETVSVLAAGAVTSTRVASGGTLIISGADTSATLASGGVESVFGSARGDAIAGVATVFSGGAVSSESVLSGGALVLNGGVDSAAIIAAGGSESVTLSGSAAGDLIYGSVGVSGGSVSGETVESGGALFISAGADSGSTILAGGHETVLTSASGDQVYGVQLVSAATAVVSNETVFTGGAVDVFLKGAVASGTIVSSGGALNVSGAAFASNTILSGGGVLALESPKAEATGSLTFAGGGNILDITGTTSAGYGVLATISGFSSTDKIDLAATAFTGSALTLSQSVSGGNTVAQVLSGGLAVETFVFSGASLAGTLGLVSDGTGGVDLEIPPVSVTTSVTTTTVSGAFVENATDTLLVLSGGSVTGATIQSGGFLTVNGGVDSGATILAGGLETVSAGSASGDQIQGVETVSGGSVSNETVLSGGQLNVAAGAVLGAVTLSGGGVLDLTASTATAGGTVTFVGGGNTLKVDALAASGAGDQALLAGFSTADKIDLSGVAPSSASLSYGTNAAGQAVVTVTTASGAESFTFSDPTVFKAGAMSLISDGAGGSDLILDTTPVIAFTSPGGATNNASQLVFGTVNVAADPEAIGETVTVTEGGTVVGTATVGSDGYWSAKVGLLNTNGANSLSASVTDAAGNTGATSASVTYNVKTNATAFAAGDLVLSVYGDGAGTGAYGLDQAAPITLEEVTTSGTYVGELVLPETTSVVNGKTQNAISGEYGSASEGTLQLSGDGHSLVIMGYGVNYQAFDASNAAAVYGTTALGQTTSIQGGAYTAVARIVADINADGVVDTSTALYNVFNTNNPRSVATVDGTNFYISGQSVKGDASQGVFYAADGASSATSINHATDTRIIEIYNGQLYVSADSTQGATNIVDYGALSSLTPPSGQVTPSVLTGISNTVTLTATNGNTVNDANGAGAGTTVNLSPESFFFANATTLYVADSGLPKNGGLGDGGLQKWVYSGGKWNLEYTLSAGLSLVANSAASGATGLIGLTGKVMSDGSVDLYATNEAVAELGQTYLYSITDQLNATAPTSGEAFKVLITAPTGQIIRGVSFAPTDSTPTLTSQVGQTVNGGAVEVKGTGVAGDTVTLYADGGSTVVGSGLVASDGTFDITTSATFADGIHTLAAAQTDSNGVLSAQSANLWVSVAPNAPTITGQSGQALNGQTIEFTGAGEAGETITLYVGSVAVGSGVVAADGTFDITTSARFVDGQYAITAVQSDADGLSSAASSAFTATVAPNAPVITGEAAATVNGQAIELLGTGAAGDTVTLYADGGAVAVGSGLVAANGTFDIITTTTFADGNHSLTAVETDAAGLASAASASFGVAVSPNAPAITGLVGQPVNGGKIEVQGTGEAGETVTLYADGGSTAVGAGVVAANGTFDITTSVAFSDGAHSLTATLTDAAGLTGAASASFGVGVNPNAPAITTLVGQPVNGGKVELKGTGEAGETITLYADGGSTAVGSGVVAANGTFDITTTASFADGKHSFIATQADAAGLTGAASGGFQVAVTPSTPVLTALVGEVTGGWKVEVQGAGEAGDTVTLYNGALVLGTATVASNGTFDIKTTNTIAGMTTANLAVAETDAAGLVSATSAAVQTQIARAGVYYLTRLAETLHGTGVGAADTVYATSSAALNPADVLDFASGGATARLYLQGGGTYDLGAVKTLTGVSAIYAEATLASQGGAQTVILRDGVNAAVSVQADPASTAAGGADGALNIVGANNSAAIKLNYGSDTVTLGSASESVTGGAGPDTVYATAATAGALVVGGTGGLTLDITGGGSATLNAGDKKLKVQLQQATTLTLNASVNQVQGSAGDDTVVVSATNLTAAANLNGGGGANTLVITGAGNFKLATPTLTNFQVIDVFEGQAAFGAIASTAQSLTLKSGLNATINVEAPASVNAANPNPVGITITGVAGDSSTLHLGSGTDTVVLGSASETVIGGAGASLIKATAATAGALIQGGSGAVTLTVGGGGAAALNAADSGVTTVNLAMSANAYSFTANGEAGLLVNDLSHGLDTLTAGGAGQTLTGGGAGKVTFIGSTAGGDTFRDTAAQFKGDTIQNFAASGDAIDVTDLNSAKLVATFVENSTGTAGQLKLTDGTHTTAINLFGQFMVAGFAGSASSAGFSSVFDGAAGTKITYQPVLATPH